MPAVPPHCFDAALPSPETFYDPVRQARADFGNALGGILFAAMAYFGVLGIWSLVVAFAVQGGNLVGTSPQDVIATFVGGILFYVLGGAFLILVFVMPLACLCLLLSWGVLRSLSLPIDRAVRGGLAGGLTGFLGTCWTVGIGNSTELYWLLGIVLGPGLATLLGQAGGSWAAFAPTPYWQRITNSIPQSGRWRFDIRQIMIATVWLAGVLTLLKLVGGLTTFSATVLFSWLAFQTISLPLVFWTVKRVRGTGQ